MRGPFRKAGFEGIHDRRALHDLARGDRIHSHLRAKLDGQLKRLERKIEAGAEFVIFDTEHSWFGHEQLGYLIASTKATGMAPLVRVANIDYPLMARPMDSLPSPPQ